ncbi:hypothetical protein Q3G72_014615 [Acer saccharum]|nr:hypothetical protein Q3G72_014615 [Acer saccharum]
MVLQAVNLRPRFEPPLPEYSFGNLYRIAVTVPSTEEDDDDQEQAAHRLIAQMRESISRVDKEYVKKLQERRFIDTVSGNGIEAWMNMKEEDMAKLEVDEELILATAA